MSLVGDTVGDVLVEARIGRGGMGEVYRGYDRKLDRLVALKTIREIHRFNDAARSRFLREARLLSRLDHPGICRIYGLLEDPAGSFLVLEHIAGTTLAASDTGQLAPEQRLDVAEQIAAAIAAAHERQIVHRDLKPHNVMLTGGGRVKVLDFGISRIDGADPGSAAGPRLLEVPGEPGREDTVTMTAEATIAGGGPRADFRTTGGGRLGTLRYMSPEQAAGRPVGKASDLYSFGILLHELWSGDHAYAADSREQLEEKVLRAETRPMKGGVDADLVRLIASLTRPDPARRPTARETVEALCDLRLKPRRLRRRRLRWLAAAAAVLTLAAAGVAHLRSRWLAGRRVELAQQFGQEGKDLEWSIRVAHTLPRHDIRPEKQRVRERLARLEARMAELGELAHAPGHYALGRGYLAIERYRQAREALAEVWESGNRTPQVAYAYGLAVGHLLHQQMTDVQSISDGEVRRLREHALREQAEEAIRLLRASRDTGFAVAEYPQALLAYFEQRYDDALGLARRAAEKESWLYEARILEGDVLRTQGYRYLSRGEYPEARALYQQADAAYRLAGAIGESDPRVDEARCELWGQAMELRLYGEGGELEPDFERAVAACERALSIDPERASTYRTLASVQLRWIEDHITRGVPVTIDEAIAAARRAVALDLGDALSHSRLGAAYLARHKAASRAGRAAGDDLEPAIDSLERALELDPRLVDAHNALGKSHRNLALVKSRRGEDASGAYDQAVASYRRAVEIHPGYGYGFNNLGRLYVQLGRDAHRRGEDPRPMWRAAEQHLARAIEINPRNAYALNNLGDAHLARGEWLLERGEPAAAALAAATGSFEAAIAAHLTYAAPHNNLGLARVLSARAAFRQGEDPEPALAAAEPALARAAELAPGAFQPPTNQGRVAWLRAEERLRRGEDPGPAIAAARERYRVALELQPSYAPGWAELARVMLTGARWELSRGRPPEPLAAVARERVEEALALDSANVLGLRTLGELAILAARRQLARGESPDASLAEAADALGRALEEAGAQPEVRQTVAELRRLQAARPSGGAVVAAAEAARP